MQERTVLWLGTMQGHVLMSDDMCSNTSKLLSSS